MAVVPAVTTATNAEEAELANQIRNEVPLALAESLKHYDTDSVEWKEVLPVEIKNRRLWINSCMYR